VLLSPVVPTIIEGFPKQRSSRPTYATSEGYLEVLIDRIIKDFQKKRQSFAIELTLLLCL
jgi:hypothetical protein